MQLAVQLEHLTPREAVADAVYRVIQGYDNNSLELFESGMTPDASFGIGDHVVHGRDRIRTESFDRIGKMDTTHFVTNHRIAIASDGATAQMTANALSQHYRPGEGTTPDAPYYLVGAKYEIDLVKDSSVENLWRVKKWLLKPVWSQGDRNVMQD